MLLITRLPEPYRNNPNTKERKKKNIILSSSFKFDFLKRTLEFMVFSPLVIWCHSEVKLKNPLLLLLLAKFSESLNCPSVSYFMSGIWVSAHQTPINAWKAEALMTSSSAITHEMTKETESACNALMVSSSWGYYVMW